MEDPEYSKLWTELVSQPPEQRREPTGDRWERYYQEFRKVAEARLARERSDSIEPAELLHEVFARLVDRTKVNANGTVYFKACVAAEFQRVLVDHARRRSALKRGGPAARATSLRTEMLGTVEQSPQTLDVAMALDELETEYERAAQVVRLRLLLGMTVPECANAIKVSPRTIDNDWAFGLAWLKRRLASLDPARE